MPIKTSCPDCDRPYNLADTMEGKTVKCKECGNSFTVEAVAEAVAAVKPANGKTKTAMTPAAKTGIKAASKTRSVAAKKKSGMPVGLLIGGGVAAALFLLLTVVAVVAGFWILGSSKGSGETTADAGNPNGTNQLVTTPTLDPSNPAPTGNPLSLVTKANFDKIKGGMIEPELLGILSLPTERNAPLNTDTANYDKATVHLWKNGQDSITVTYCNRKCARWVGVFAGQTETKLDPTYVLTKSNSPSDPSTNPGATTLITKANFDKIMGGNTIFDLKGLLGTPTNAKAPVDAAVKPLVGPKGTAQTWQNGSDFITVCYYNGKATHWSGMIDGQAVGPVDDSNYAYKPNSPTPPLTTNPTTKVTLANYTGINLGVTDQSLFQFFGPATNQTPPRTTPATKFKPMAVTTYSATWNDNQGGHMTIHFTNGAVSQKTESRLK